MRPIPPALKTKALSSEQQAALSEDLSKCYAGAIHTYERLRPDWVNTAARAMQEKRGHLNSVLQAMIEKGASAEDIESVKKQIVENELALGKSPVMTTSVNQLARDLMDKYAAFEVPAEHDAAAFDSSSAKSEAGVLSADKLRRQINRNIVRVKIGGQVFSGSANAVASYIAQKDRIDRAQFDLMSKKIANQQLSNNKAGILADAIVDAENREDNAELKIENDEVDNEYAFETARESAIEAAEARREAMIESGVEPGLDDDLYDDIGVNHTASDVGIDLAFDNESTRLEIEREVEIDLLRQRFEAGTLSEGELKSELQRIENDYADGSLKLARSHSVLRTPELKKAWEDSFRAAGRELPKGDPSNRALSPSSATGSLMHGLEDAASAMKLEPKPPESFTGN